MVINGTSGNDTLISGNGDDTIDGFAGFDFVSYASAVSGVTVDLGAGTATGGAGNDTLLNIEAVLGSNFNDTLTGDAQGNWIDGGGGADTFFGNAGNDGLVGGTGHDRIAGA